VSKVIWQKAVLPNCHPSLLKMDSSDLDPILDLQQSAPKLISIGSTVLHSISMTDTQTHRPRYVQHL